MFLFVGIELVCLPSAVVLCILNGCWSGEWFNVGYLSRVLSCASCSLWGVLEGNYFSASG